jgi:hypothetical protein
VEAMDAHGATARKKHVVVVVPRRQDRVK